MNTILFKNGSIVLPDRVLPNGQVLMQDGRIAEVGAAGQGASSPKQIDLQGKTLSPGFVDLHVHGGQGADFMDGTTEAFQTVCQAHLRHGTTSLLPTTTVAEHEQHMAFLQTCRQLKKDGSGSARILGAHFYGPYFAKEARGCHPEDAVREPTPIEYLQYLEFADCITRATVAPELNGAEAFIRECRNHGIRGNAGHSYATFEQMEKAMEWGVDHVDHLFCAMSDRARLRQSQTYPMRGGVMEATLFFDELTTEVIADGKHLQRELLMLAYKTKGPDRLALVTDCNRALDMPDGEYIFGPLENGEPIIRRDGVGIMPDGTSLASGVAGMDDCVRTFHELTGVELTTVIRMASLTPARIAGWEQDIGSIEVGKRADLVVLGDGLEVERVFVDGVEQMSGSTDG